jgi:hypothetical protein
MRAEQQQQQQHHHQHQHQQQQQQLQQQQQQQQQQPQRLPTKLWWEHVFRNVFQPNLVESAISRLSASGTDAHANTHLQLTAM